MKTRNYRMRAVRAASLGLFILCAGCMMMPVKDSTVRSGVEAAPDSQPAWQTVLEGANELDILRPFGGNRLIAGTLELSGSGYIWSPGEKDLALLDAKDGRVLWSVPRKQLGMRLHEAYDAGQAVVLEGVDSHDRPVLVGLDGADGSVKWRRGEPALDRLRVSGATALLEVKDGSGLLLKAVDLESNRDLWEAAFPAGGPVELSDAGVAAAAGELALLDLRGGSRIWQAPLPSGAARALTAYSGIGLLLLETDARIAAYGLSTGRALWERSLEGRRIVSQFATSSGLVVVTAGADLRMEHYDARTGRLLWAIPLAEGLAGSIARGATGLFVRTGGDLALYDEQTGALKYRVALPQGLASQGSLPDHVVVSGDKVIVAREGGVVALRASDGTVVYAHEVCGSRPLTFDYIWHKAEVRGMAPEQASAWAPSAAAAAASGAASSSATILAASAQQQQAYVQMQTAPVLASGSTSSYAERQAAIQMRATATQGAYAMARQAAATQMVAAINAMGAAGVSAAMAWRGEFIGGSRQVTILQLRQTLATHSRSIQSGYYVRPFWDRGWGLTLVALETGERRDILLSPDNDPVRMNGANLPAFVLDPETGRLFAAGVGFDPARYVTYTKSAASSQIAFFPYRWKVPYLSLLAYDLAGISGARTAPCPAAQEPGAVDAAYLEAARTGDAEEVKKRLDEGANVDAVDRYGYSALMYLAVLDHKALIRDLLRRGADATIADDHGWTAFRYISFNYPASRSGEMLMNATKRQLAKKARNR